MLTKFSTQIPAEPSGNFQANFSRIGNYLRILAGIHIHGGKKPYSAADLLVKFTRNLQVGHFEGDGIGYEWREIYAEVDRVEFFNMSAALWKKADAPALAERIDYAERLTESSPKPFAWHRLYTFIMLHNGPLDGAEAAAKRFADNGGPPALYHTCLSHIRQKAGNMEGAIAEARLAVDTSFNKSGVGEIARLDALLAMQAKA